MGLAALLARLGRLFTLGLRLIEETFCAVSAAVRILGTALAQALRLCTARQDRNVVAIASAGDRAAVNDLLAVERDDRVVETRFAYDPHAGRKRFDDEHVADQEFDHPAVALFGAHQVALA